MATACRFSPVSRGRKRRTRGPPARRTSCQHPQVPPALRPLPARPLVTMKRPAPGDRRACYWLMSWLTGSWKVELPSEPEPLWRKGADSHAYQAAPPGGARASSLIAKVPAHPAAESSLSRLARALSAARTSDRPVRTRGSLMTGGAEPSTPKSSRWCLRKLGPEPISRCPLAGWKGRAGCFTFWVTATRRRHAGWRNWPGSRRTRQPRSSRLTSPGPPSG
jgi:hypothetical protein